MPPPTLPSILAMFVCRNVSASSLKTDLKREMAVLISQIGAEEKQRISSSHNLTRSHVKPIYLARKKLFTFVRCGLRGAREF